MELWVNEIWLFFTAVIFTVVGWWFGVKSQAINAVEATIESLIQDGYLKTKGEGADMVILKHREWHNDVES